MVEKLERLDKLELLELIGRLQSWKGRSGLIRMKQLKSLSCSGGLRDGEGGEC